MRRLILVVLLAAGARVQAAIIDENAVRAVFAQETEAWRKHDAKGVSSLYTVDAVWQNPFGVRLKSSAALEKFLMKLLVKQAGGWKISECMIMDEIQHP
jgi:uncharacterized protein (TIGR02246 family)